MKEKELIDVVEEPLQDLNTLYEEYSTYVKMETELRKKKDKIKMQLKEYFDKAEKDNAGNFWLEAGNGRFKKELRQKMSLNPIFADPILKRLGLYEKVVSYEPVYDVDMIQNYISDGTIIDEDVNKMFEVEESYVIKAEKAQKKEEALS